MHPDLTAFLTAKAAAGLSVSTLDWYARLVGQFLAWADERKLEIKKPETVEGFLTDLRYRKLSPFTISGCYRSLSAYFKWLVQRKKLRTSPMALVQRPKLPKQRKRHVTQPQFNKLYTSITGESWTDYRDRAILLILYYSGLRANELLSLRHDSIDRQRGVIIVEGGKGDKDRDVPYDPDAIDMLDVYLCLCPGYNPDHLFLAGGGVHNSLRGPLTFNGLSQMVRRRCEQAGMARLGLHAFRHGFAMLFLNEGGMELASVSKSLGHSSVDLTRRFYADYETTTLRLKYHTALHTIKTPKTE